MFKEEENKLNDMKEKYQEIIIPDQIDAYIKAGIQQVDKRKRKSRTSIFTTIAAGVMIFVLLASIRISPAFASYVSQIPGFERIVAFVQGDKGLEAAVRNDFIQEIGKSDSHNGITFTVDGIIADESRAIIFYTIKTERDIETLDFRGISIRDQDNKSLIGAISHGGPVDGLKKGEEYESTLDIDLAEGTQAPETITVENKMEIGFADGTKLTSENYKVTFPIEQEKFFGNKQVHQVNKTVTVEGQKITFKEITVYPTRIAIQVSFDKNNTKRIFSFDDLKIVNENGEEWARINNGTIAKGRDNDKVLYLQSNYFTNPKELYIEFSSIRALDKNQLEVVIDLDKGELVKNPNNQLEILDLSDESDFFGKDKMELKLLLKRDSSFDKMYSYGIFEQKIYTFDGKGHDLTEGIGSSVNPNTLDTEFFIPLKREYLEGPVTFKIVDYPTRITKNIRIKVK